MSPRSYFFSCAGILSLSFALQAFAENTVITEIRKLRASLPANDPSRGELSLRLADRLSDEVLVKGSTGETKATENSRKEAITLYREVLPKMRGESAVKIQFQLARLYAEHSPSAEAKELFGEVAAHASTRELKREATLRLAEIAENDSKNYAEAVTYYKKVLELCDGGDSCSYSRYRLAWASRTQGKISEAIEEMKLALYDSKGQVREEALRDLIGFMSLTGQQTDSDLSYVDSLSTHLARPQLLEDLANAYFANGNKNSGVKVMALTHSRHPTVDSTVRLMEEYYGLRDWDQFRALSGQLETFAKDPNAKSSIKDAIETEKICRRLATQLDGERTSDASRFLDFKEFTLSYLELFPGSSERAKIMEGLVTAEPSADAKVEELNTWLSSPLYHLSSDDQMNLRELRISIAQKEAKKSDEKAEGWNRIVVSEAKALIDLGAANPKAKAKTREYRYARARANYAMKAFADSTPEFVELATLTADTPDTYAIQSQHLLMDTYNQQKDFSKLIATAKTWTENASLRKNPRLTTDLKEMNHIEDEAAFEMATLQSQNAAQAETALASFVDFCAQGKFVPKSCDNAKVLAVNRGNFPKTLAVLELEAKQNRGKPEDLAAEYENGGFYEQAGNQLQKVSGATTSFRDQMKMALMFELARNFPKRDTVLKNILSLVSSKKMKLNESEEKAFVETLKDTSLLDDKMFKAASTSELKAMIAEYLGEKGKPTAETKSFLISQLSYQGTYWAGLVNAQADQLAGSVSKIQFYGKNGQVAFKKRVNALKGFNEFAEKYLSGGADVETRVHLLTLLKRNYDDISNEVLASPIPASLNEEQVAQIKTGLSEMAAPFSKKGSELASLLETEKRKMPTQAASQVASKTLNLAVYDQAVKELHQDPKDATALNQLKQVFENAKMNRLSAYFEGRVSVLGKSPVSVKQ